MFRVVWHIVWSVNKRILRFTNILYFPSLSSLPPWDAFTDYIVFEYRLIVFDNSNTRRRRVNYYRKHNIGRPSDTRRESCGNIARGRFLFFTFLYFNERPRYTHRLFTPTVEINITTFLSVFRLYIHVYHRRLTSINHYLSMNNYITGEQCKALSGRLYTNVVKEWLLKLIP